MLEEEELLERIAAFELDDVGASLSFTSRLAREQGWTHVFAGRVVREYLRFVGLAMVAGHPVTPSEQVDQVWHLHLVYTRSYWDELCGKVLGRALHHGPTKGGAEEGEKFEDWYGKTLESYGRVYGEVPPSEIWPSVEERFADAGAGRWVDSSRFWIFRRPRFWYRWFR